MRTILSVLTLVVAALAAPKPSSIFSNYHEDIGIPEAARIKAAESALDFDGSRIIGGSTSRLGQFPHFFEGCKCRNVREYEATSLILRDPILSYVANIAVTTSNRTMIQFEGGLVVSMTTGSESVCGSSLLTNTRAITAAHCWRHHSQRARQFTVVLASTTLFTGGIRLETSDVVMHPLYRDATLHNDVAIINLRFVWLINNIGLISLPRDQAGDFVGFGGTAVGFGLTHGGGGNVPRSTVLRHVNLNVISNAACRRRIHSDYIISSTLCTSTTSSSSTCEGDSGGPLQVAGPILIGIKSFNSDRGCGRGEPTGFARVTSFLSWIRGRL